MIIENLKSAWDLTRANSDLRNQIENSRKKIEVDELLELINTTIVENYEKTQFITKSADREIDELIRLLDKSSETKPTRQQEHKPASTSAKESFNMAREILKAFRKEFLSAKEHIEKESKAPIEKQADLSKIDKAILDIENVIFRRIK